MRSSVILSPKIYHMYAFIFHGETESKSKAPIQVISWPHHNTWHHLNMAAIWNNLEALLGKLWEDFKSIAKRKTEPRFGFCLGNSIFQVISQVLILIKFHLQNLDQASTPKSQPNISLFTKLKLQNFDQTQPQNLDHDSTSQTSAKKTGPSPASNLA